MTYASDEYDEEAYEVTGTLSTRASPFGTQCFVDGVQVDPDTVHAAEEELAETLLGDAMGDADAVNVMPPA